MKENGEVLKKHRVQNFHTTGKEERKLRMTKNLAFKRPVEGGEIFIILVPTGAEEGRHDEPKDRRNQYNIINDNNKVN